MDEGDSTVDIDREEAASMFVGPDELREEDEGYVLECPACGTTTRLVRIVETGRCAGYETEMDCTARLAVELLWTS
ncbi:hypothetical protein [Halegenticoccus tardaugens]|uniref:hypothetical protein n=1 Tax=Halegenticoccus tardaugens TaxID=2071624 RepID=UPI00100A3249|nr:hypothetical protein [Halegenticoccus tardaugens]